MRASIGATLSNILRSASIQAVGSTPILSRRERALRLGGNGGDATEGAAGGEEGLAVGLIGIERINQRRGSIRDSASVIEADVDGGVHRHLQSLCRPLGRAVEHSKHEDALYRLAEFVGAMEPDRSAAT